MGITPEQRPDKQPEKPPEQHKLEGQKPEQTTSDHVSTQAQKLLETEKPTLPPSMIPFGTAQCDAALASLKDKLSGKPILQVVNPKLADKELQHYQIKQPNEQGLRPDLYSSHDLEGALGFMRPGSLGTLDAPREGEGISKELAPYFKDMQTVFGQTQIFDIFRNHDEILSSGNLAAKLQEQLDRGTKAVKQEANTPTILFNIDAHVDAYSGQQVVAGQENIAMWVNGMLRNNPNINEFYWIVPDNFKSDPKIAENYFGTKNTKDTPDYDHVFVNTPSDFTMYLDKKTGELTITGKPADYSEDKYRAIEFHKKTLSELPDMSGKRIALAYDLDYSGGNGYDTSYSASVPWKGAQGLIQMVETLKEKNVRPFYTTISVSPEYVQKEHLRDLVEFSSLIADATGKNPVTVTPEQTAVYDTDLAPHGLLHYRNSPETKLLYEMRKIDSKLPHPTDSIDLNKMQSGSPQEKQAIEDVISATSRLYNTDRTTALGILKALDAKDGKSDGIIRFDAMEALLKQVCKSKEKPHVMRKRFDAPDPEP